MIPCHRTSVLSISSGEGDDLEQKLKPRELPPLGRAMREEFLMNPEFIQLNHGAYGPYPREVRTALHEFQDRAERNIDRWLRIDVLDELLNVRKHLAAYMNADDPDDLVIVPNTTAGLNSIFRSLKFHPGDKILHFSTYYEGVRGMLQYITDSNDGNVSLVQFKVNYPITNDKLVQKFEIFLNEFENSGIRIAVIDHISSVPSVLNPISRIIPLLKAKNILIVVDGAHAVGHVPVDLKALDVDFYVSSCHKWLYTARRTGVMYVKKQHKAWIHPTRISTFYSTPANFQKEFYWTGTNDFSSYMTIPAALAFRAKIGEAALRNYTHNLAVRGGALVAKRLGTSVLQTEDQIGNMVDVLLPIANPENEPASDLLFWRDELLNKHNMFAFVFKHNGKLWVRFSAQVYTDLSDFEKAAGVFKMICERLNHAGT